MATATTKSSAHIKPKSWQIVAILALSIVSLTLGGCKNEIAESRAIEEAVARALAEERLAASERLQQAVREAEARAIASAMQKLNATGNDARRDGFDAGKLAGHASAVAEFEAKIELVRTQAYDKGKQAGEAMAAAKHFERGLDAGKDAGVLQGRDEAKQANETEIQLAVEKAVNAAEKLATAEGIEQGRRTARVEELGKSSIPTMLAVVAMLLVIFFCLVRRDNRSANESENRSNQIVDLIIGEFEQRHRAPARIDFNEPGRDQAGASHK